jgi:hypothetical protein
MGIFQLWLVFPVSEFYLMGEAGNVQTCGFCGLNFENSAKKRRQI